MSQDWGTVFREMLVLTSERRSVDVSILGQRCPNVDLRRLMDEVSIGHRADANELSIEIRGMAERRRLVFSLEKVIRSAQEADTETLLAHLSEAVAKALAGGSESKLLSPDQAVEHYLSSVAIGAGGLTWAPSRLNHLLQPVRGGEMVVAAARPSVGKTVLCEMLVEHWARESGKPVLFVSLEMGIGKLIDRSLKRSSADQIPVPGTLARTTREQLSARRDVQVWYLDDPRATTAGVRSAAAKVKMLGSGLAAIAVDYIGLLKDKAGGDNDNRRISYISSELKAIAREFEVPVLALSQLNRNSARRDDPIPRLDDIRDSGAVEQDADIVLGLHREIGSRYMQIKSLKNRDGAAGHVALLDFDEEKVLLS